MGGRLVSNPEALLLSAVFFFPLERAFEDSDLREVVGGVTLSATLLTLLSGLEQSPYHRKTRPVFCSRVRRQTLLRFGFDDGKSHSLQEIGEIFGVSRESVRQHENVALRLLRHKTRISLLRPYIIPEIDQ